MHLFVVDVIGGFVVGLLCGDKEFMLIHLVALGAMSTRMASR
ncbi:DUF6552 family protein [Tritonibacter mobilis]|nr:DUF6552 family protein [Tritonibacter mobilis]